MRTSADVKTSSMVLSSTYLVNMDCLTCSTSAIGSTSGERYC